MFPYAVSAIGKSIFGASTSRSSSSPSPAALKQQRPDHHLPVQRKLPQLRSNPPTRCSAILPLPASVIPLSSPTPPTRGTRSSRPPSQTALSMKRRSSRTSTRRCTVHRLTTRSARWPVLKSTCHENQRHHGGRLRRGGHDFENAYGHSQFAPSTSPRRKSTRC